MDAPALCDSILQFVGRGLPTQGSSSSIPVPDLPDGAAGERVSQSDTSGAAGNDRTGSTAASSATEQQKLGLMRAFMGNKLGEFNLRGVEAGMGMVKVTNRKTGKMLNSGRRQRREEQNAPYGRRPSSRGGKSKHMATQAEHLKPRDAQAASTNAASSQAASSQAASTATTAQPGSSVGSAVDSSVGVD